MDTVWSSASGSATLTFAITDLVDVADLEQNYYHYEGSLTTPPCTPSVRWHLAQNTIKISKSTMDTFRTATRLWKHIDIDADSNFRPVLPNPSCIWTCSGNR